MRVVLDTNVYAAWISTRGAADRVIRATVKARWRLYTSQFILDEFERIAVTRLEHPLADVRIMRRAIARMCQPLVDPIPSRHVVPRDPSDTPVLRTAIAANADFLVSRDSDLLTLDPYEGIRIVSLAEYHRILELENLL